MTLANLSAPQRLSFAWQLIEARPFGVSRRVLYLALVFGLSLLAVNAVIVMASYLFPHLAFGVIVISVSAWVAVLLLAVYPQLLLWQMVQEAKQATLQALEQRLVRHYHAVLEGQPSESPSLDDTLKLYQYLLGSKSSPISGGEVIGIVATVVLNVVPLLAQFFNR
ncbi:MAG: hypothetical protein ACRDH2_04745 [Anaerolineales bacterium]